ncbi:glycosyl hydrolase family 28-related protein [Paenibacillus sp. GCM10027626]|uniref:glycosyl hydrolase family 28-related protein n=1 Tax=Paenibacillus sp. GCM10027626 TaxID=3273411 RepID=UPI00362842DD
MREKGAAFLLSTAFLVMACFGLIVPPERAEAATVFSATWDTGTNFGETDTPEFPVSNVVGYNFAGNPQANQASSGTQGIAAHSGDGYLQVAGKDVSSAASSYAYHRIYGGLSIPVTSGMHLSYWVYHYAHATTSQRMGFDLVFSDNTTLRDSMLSDTNGVRMHPAHRNESLNQWVQVDVDLSPLAGKTITKILVAYDGSNDSETGQYVSYFDDLVISGSSTGGSGINPRVITTAVYPSDDVIIASVDAAADYGADATGAADATSAIQSAIDAVYNAGGGVVWLPAGKYKVTSSIIVREHVTLRGDWRDPDVGSGSYGTVIMANVASGSAGDPGLFRIGGSAGVKGLTVYYPTQSASAPTAYPYTFEILGGALSGNGYMSASIQNVTMLNSYRGISAGYLATHEMHLIRNVKGTALANAIYLEDTADVGKVDRVKFNNSYWANMDASVSSTKPTRAQIDTWTRANGTGLELRGVEWHQMADVVLYDYNVGIVINAGRRINFTGMMFGIDVQNSNIGMLVNALDSRVGVNISNATISANQGTNPVAVKITNSNGASILFNNSTIGGGAVNAVQLLGNTMAEFQNVTFDSWSGTYGLIANKGTLVVEDSTFMPTLSATKKGIQLQAGTSSATILASVFSPGGSAYLLENSSSGDVKRQETGYFFTKHNVTNYPWRPSVPGPSSSSFFNVKSAPYNAAGVPSIVNPLVDDTAAIQAALNDAGAAGGGTVYLPAGIYRINTHLTVPAGVQLRGSDDVPHRAAKYGPASGTILYAYEGKGTATPDMDTPFIQLNGANAGVRGLSIHYPEQSNTSSASIRAYPWTIKGSGDSVYVFDVTFVNAYKGLDFASVVSTNNHYVNQVNGFVLKEGIRVGNATEGWVEDSLFNATHWSRAAGLPNIVDEGTTMWSVAFAYSRANAKNFVVTSGAQNEHLLNNFVYGSNTGLTVESNANVTAINNAADGSLNTIRVTGTGTGGAKIINAEGCGCGLGGTAISVSGGVAQIYNMLTMESYNSALQVTGGSLVLQGAAFHHNTAAVSAGNLLMGGALFRDDTTHITVASGATVNLWGNIGGGASGFRFNFASGSFGGYSMNIRR